MLWKKIPRLRKDWEIDAAYLAVIYIIVICAAIAELVIVQLIALVLYLAAVSYGLLGIFQEESLEGKWQMMMRRALYETLPILPLILLSLLTWHHRWMYLRPI